MPYPEGLTGLCARPSLSPLRDYSESGLIQWDTGSGTCFDGVS
jgi:hypothetical protein